MIAKGFIVLKRHKKEAKMLAMICQYCVVAGTMVVKDKKDYEI